jgi:predicted amidophosphoribosyltransferase
MALVATSGGRDVRVVPALRMKALVRDSVGLSGAARQRNVAGRVRLCDSPNRLSGDVLVVDDIVTTGATAAESVRVLQTSGARVIAVLALANA